MSLFPLDGTVTLFCSDAVFIVHTLQVLRPSKIVALDIVCCSGEVLDTICRSPKLKLLYLIPFFINLNLLPIIRAANLPCKDVVVFSCCQSSRAPSVGKCHWVRGACAKLNIHVVTSVSSANGWGIDSSLSYSCKSVWTCSTCTCKVPGHCDEIEPQLTHLLIMCMKLLSMLVFFLELKILHHHWLYWWCRHMFHHLRECRC